MPVLSVISVACLKIFFISASNPGNVALNFLARRRADFILYSSLYCSGLFMRLCLEISFSFSLFFAFQILRVCNTSSLLTAYPLFILIMCSLFFMKYCFLYCLKCSAFFFLHSLAYFLAYSMRAGFLDHFLWYALADSLFLYAILVPTRRCKNYPNPMHRDRPDGARI